MPAPVLIKRTATPNNPPADLSLQPGELALEMADPTRLWVGVTTALDATGKKLLLDSSTALTAPPSDTFTYGLKDGAWDRAMPLVGGQPPPVATNTGTAITIAAGETTATTG